MICKSLRFISFTNPKISQPKYVNIFCLNYRFISINEQCESNYPYLPRVLWPVLKANKDCFAQVWEFQLEPFKQRCWTHPNHLLSKVKLLTRSFLFQTNPYGMKDGGGGTDMGAWGSAALPPTAGYYSYDHPTLAAYGYVSLSRDSTRQPP